MAEGAAKASLHLFVERTLLFTDIEGSTERWDADPESMHALLGDHDLLIAEVISRHHGTLIHGTGDGAVAAFESITDAVCTALDFQYELTLGPERSGIDIEPLRVRMGIHCGVVESRGGDLFGPVMHRCARIMSAGHGGQILLSRTAADQLRASSPVPMQLIDRGVHRLKGFHEPETIVELLRPGAVATERTLRTENAVEGWLPAIDADTFIAREAELTELDHLLEPGSLVTLVGTGGVGKTRLAVHAAHVARRAFPDGTWFVDLAPVNEPARVLSSFADLLELTDDSTESLTAAVRRALVERRALYVLDNCEHVLDGVTAMLNAVRSDVCRSALLCTSQSDLGLPGEHVLQVSPLAIAGDRCDSPAAQLFFDRAVAANPVLVVDDESRRHVATICERVEGLPLAIELAAARVRIMDVATIAERLGDTFDLLRTRAPRDRHDTLDATIAWSVELLSETDRDTLFSLSVFNATFDLPAAVAVTGQDELDVADALDALVRRSLVVPVAPGFRLLAPMRRYCAAALGRAGREPQVRARHARWMQQSVPIPLDDLDPLLVTSRMNRLTETYEDLQPAHRWLVEHDPAAAGRMALDLVDFWNVRSRGNEAISWLAACDTDDVPTEIRVELLGWIAGFGWTVGRNHEGEEAARRALELAAQNGLPLPTFAATRLAVRLSFSNRTDESLELARAVEREVISGAGEISRTLAALAVVVAVGGDTPHALELVDRAIADARSVGVVRLLSAIANRLLIAPTDPVSDALITEAAEIARMTGRTSVLAHTVLAAAHRRLKASGDGREFLRGIAEFVDLQVQNEPTAALGALQLALGPAADANARGAAMLLAAVERLAIEHDHEGTDLERQRREEIRHSLRTELGSQDFDRATVDGEELTLKGAIDLLHWVCDPEASALTGSSTC